MPKPYSGKFVSFEGIDFSGKSEQYDRVKKYLSAYFPKLKVQYLKEPVDKEIYDVLFGRHKLYRLGEMHSYEFQAWYFRDRVHDYKRNVIPALERGESVMMDRGPLSVVFGASHIGDIRHLMEIQWQFFLGAEVPFVWPDANIIFDIPIEVFSERAKAANRPKDEFENPTKQLQVRDNYTQFANMYPNCHIVDGNRDPKVIFDDVWEILSKVLEIDPK